MTRMGLLPWWNAVHDILGYWPDMTELVRSECSVDAMWNAGLSPVEAAAAITVAEFERSFNA